ncbi:hypothetical protein PF005_g30544 [Phytophthora fragariae]|uniref:Uncharacterized protein n=1 Tax=Phytophthora fragariae TaxID=53985 RepID=A0A6A3VCY8_9STRA|nr:hypothetical protein PF003_g23009 [Phytophthora fragariae]KAE8917164.1 hypothetical protein PF009_g32514 [Phytophthora fragariae]KAE9056097.1 hypothetical protein PF007_g32099 [Phytophthora fragariae]KAE9057149.1 hypothetical protein PF006_g32501 [Phytophthora fragariae]KAE9060550.1 hypothetical protein PF010_g30175 [Phytophthora fragariae]
MTGTSLGRVQDRGSDTQAEHDEELGVHVEGECQLG